MKIRCIITSLLVIILGNNLMAQSWKKHSVLAHGNWYKIAIEQSGIYKIGIKNIPQLTGVDVNKIAIYSMEGGQLPMNNNAKVSDDLVECTIEIVDKNKNKILDNDDYILFYAEGASIWRYNEDSQFIEYLKNTYSSYNYVYLTTDASNGKRIESTPYNNSNAISIDSYTAVGVIDNDITNTHKSGQIWVGEHFNNAIQTRNVTITMPTIKQGESMRVYLGFAHLSTERGSFEIGYNNAKRTIYMTKNDLYKTVYESYPTHKENTIQFSINYHPQENMAEGYLDYIQINAIAPLTYEGKKMDMWHRATGDYKYHIINSPSDLKIWDVSNVTYTQELEVHNGTFQNSIEDMHHYIAFTPNQCLSPSAITQISNQDLHSTNNVNLLIVTHPDFKESAEELADLHRLMDRMSVAVVTPNEIYNEFSSGRQDPIAIRRMLRMMWQRWETDNTLDKPQYLLLFGKGTYDHRNLLGNNKGCVVTYQSPASFDDERRSFCSDDMMGFMAPNAIGSSTEKREISIGRLPASTKAEAQLIVNKIERYMTRADLLNNDNSRGDWRNYVTLLADDADPSKPGDTSFTYSSEYTAQTIQKKYPYINVDKIYADSYIQQSGAIGSYYPDVNNALRNRINYGTLLLNYVGHGSVLYIGTERYMEIPDIEGYTNIDRLAFFVTSTCSFGRYDDPEILSGAEAFLLAKNAGIGSIAASRPIGHEKTFNTMVCSNMLDPDLTIGDALRIAKNNRYAPMSVTLFGDPALKLSTPQKNIVVTHINGEPVNENIVDTGLVLSKITVEGEIRNSDSTIDKNFNGAIYSIVYDRKQSGYTLANDNEGCEVPYTQQKNVLYKGRDTVINGKWSYSFIVPKDVAYQYDYGRLSHYARDGQIDASGSYTNIVFGGFNKNADLTETYPKIQLYINDSNFVNGGLTDNNPNIYAVLKDNIGINAFGSGLGHDITAIVDNNPNNIIILNDFYETDLYDNHKGYIIYKLNNLEAGIHTLTLKAWNIYNYSNSATIQFRVKGSDSLGIGHFYATPNPAQQYTTIHIGVNKPQNISNANIYIYNTMGQMIKKFTPTINKESYTLGPIRWNMKNEAGNDINDGIYIMKTIINTTDDNTLTKTSKIIKLQ